MVKSATASGCYFTYLALVGDKRIRVVFHLGIWGPLRFVVASTRMVLEGERGVDSRRYVGVGHEVRDQEKVAKVTAKP